MAIGVRMALGSLMSLVFGRKRLAASMLRLAETLNHPNQIRSRNGQAFPLPSTSTERWLLHLRHDMIVTAKRGRDLLRTGTYDGVRINFRRCLGMSSAW
jgi:hypothetical protein